MRYLTYFLIAVMALALLAVGQTAYAQCTCVTGCNGTSISAPFSAGGEGEYCWVATDLGAYVQSWGCEKVEITGVDYTNLYIPTGDLLRASDGKYYIYYKGGSNGSFQAQGDSIIGCCPGGCPYVWCTCEQYGDMEFDGYNLNNNTWGATEGSQCMRANSYNDWDVHAEFPETSGVKSYPRVGKHLDTNISQLGSCMSSFNVSVPSSGSYATTYDIWVPSEVMIWMNKTGAVGPIAESWDDQGNPIPSATNLTVGGHTWNVYHGGSNVVSFVRTSNTNAATVDISAILNWIKNQGWIGDGPVESLEFGFEITSAPGGLDFTLNSYTLSVSGGGGTTTTTTTAATTTTTAAGTTTTTTAATTTTTASCKGEGESCSSDSECCSGNCSGTWWKTCAAGTTTTAGTTSTTAATTTTTAACKGEGERCSSDSECCSGNCSGTWWKTCAAGGSTTTTASNTTTTTTASNTTTTTSGGGGGCDCGTCNWYGSDIPTCCEPCSGWGWSDGGCNRSCVCEGSCPNN